MLPWLLDSIAAHVGPPGKALDAFSGSGVVAWGLAREGWSVTASDRLLSSYWIVRGFLTAPGPISDETRDRVLAKAANGHGDHALFATYQGRFYPDEEMAWLDSASYAIGEENEEDRGLLYWALSQASLARRPFNLFHRSNLAIRTREVARTFGNKTTWERPFPETFNRFVIEANTKRFLAPKGTRIVVSDPVDVKGKFKLVYADPPYINKKGGATPYNDYYGFLDVLCDRSLITSADTNKPHRPPIKAVSEWENAKTIHGAFEKLFSRHQESVIAVSYREDGIPSIGEIKDMLAKYKNHVSVHTTPLRYVLSTGMRNEILVIGED